MSSDRLRVVDGVGTPKIAMASVIAGLVQGMSVSAAADAAGVKRSTVLAWHNTDEDFQQMLAECEDEIVERLISDGATAVVSRLQNLGPKAVDVVEAQLDSADARVALAAANSVLRYTPQPKSGPSKPIESVVRGVDGRPAAGD